jgi:hypothetical protein
MLMPGMLPCVHGAPPASDYGQPTRPNQLWFSTLETRKFRASSAEEGTISDLVLFVDKPTEAEVDIVDRKAVRPSDQQFAGLSQ